MESRYLYRGKRTDTGEWVYGLPSYEQDGKIGEIVFLTKEEAEAKLKERSSHEGE